MTTRTITVQPEIADLAEWLETQCVRHSYGSFGITATLHNGAIKRVERHAVESLKPYDGQTDERTQR